MEFNKVTLEVENQVAILRFNHPEALNAIGVDMLEGLAEAVGEVQRLKNKVRCLVITGSGRGFCSGANLSDRGGRRRSSKSGGSGGGLRSSYHPLFFTLRDLEMPIVTAVNGAAAGVGMSFALLGDIVCASKDAFFLQAFARIGLVPDGGATFMLPRMIGWGRAMELSLLAERLYAEKASDWGLVNRVFDDNDQLMRGALDIAHKLAKGPRSLALMRKAYWATWSNSYEQQLELEAQLQNQAGQTKDNAEGVAAFLEKRDAIFKGE